MGTALLGGIPVDRNIPCRYNLSDQLKGEWPVAPGKWGKAAAQDVAVAAGHWMAGSPGALRASILADGQLCRRDDAEFLRLPDHCYDSPGPVWAVEGASGKPDSEKVGRGVFRVRL